MTNIAGTTAAPARHSILITALVALAVLGVLSEAAYLTLAAAPYYCVADGRFCDTFLADVARPLFDAVKAEDGRVNAYNIFAFGLPGLNNIYFLLFTVIEPAMMWKFGQTVVIAYLVGFMAIFGFLHMAAGRGLFIRLLLAMVFAVIWFALYTGAELSLFGGEFAGVFQMRYFEIVTTTLTLFITSFFVSRSI